MSNGKRSERNIDVVNDKINVSLLKYRSAQILKDTDFDGVHDGYGAEKVSEDEKYKNKYNDNNAKDNSIEDFR